MASATLVPGALEPVRTPTGRWRLPLGALILDLAGQAGVDPAALHEPEAPNYPARPADHDILPIRGRRSALRSTRGRSTAAWPTC